MTLGKSPITFVIAHLSFQVAIILIFKHAAILVLSGASSKSALTQVELAFQKANIMSNIQEHFTASFQEYTNEQFTSFLVNTEISLSGLTSTQVMAYIALKALEGWYMVVRNICVKNGFPMVVVS